MKLRSRVTTSVEGCDKHIPQVETPLQLHKHVNRARTSEEQAQTQEHPI
jgi:hypothetical protein